MSSNYPSSSASNYAPTVKCPIFNGNNYQNWSNQMRTILDSEGLSEIVRDGYEQPRDATELAYSWKDDEKKRYREQQKTDAMASLYILQTVDHGIMKKIWEFIKKTKLQESYWMKDEAASRFFKHAEELSWSLLPLIMDVATSKDVWEILKNKDYQSVEVEGIQEISSDAHSEDSTVIERDMMMMEMENYIKGEMDIITRSKLFHLAMRGAWNEVIEIYTRKAVAHCIQITNSGDTALHMAVIGGKEEEVEKLVNLMSSTEAKKALENKNGSGNTPLHLAALVGNAKLCDCIARKVVQTGDDYVLVGLRNNDNQTPLYLAALHGKKNAFLRLHCLVPNDQAKLHYRGKNGETILHVAISGEFFDIAFHIIHWHPEVVDMVNERGDSPLHYLANRPTAFRSGLNLRHYHKIIYHCTFVDKLVLMKAPVRDGASQNSNNHVYPVNYKTCINILSLLKKIFNIVLGKQQKDADTLPLNNPSQDINNRGHLQKLLSWLKNAVGSEKESTNDRAQRGGLVPPNYHTIFDLLKLALKAMLVILGLGSMGITRIREKKEKHTWSVQVINALLDKSSAMYIYDNSGGKPPKSGSESKSESESEPFGLPPVEQELKTNKEKGTEQPTDKTGKEPLMVAKNGITKTVEQILKRFLEAFQDTNSQQKIVGVLAVEKTEPYDYQILLTRKEKTTPQMERRETAILIAAKNGITEIVGRILDKFPVAILDVNSQNKNVVLLAVENRQPLVYQHLVDLTKKTKIPDWIFRQVDDKGNSARHLAAATVGEHKPWRIPGAALQMQWEIKWYKFVKHSMSRNFFARHNFDGQTPKDIFTNAHQDLVKSGGEWLTNTSESCSVVAALIATVAFATAATVPGGTNDETGAPVLEKQAAFKVFAVSSLVALCFSVTSVVMFLAILTSRYQAKDFRTNLPRKLLIGLTSLFVSIGAILLCFCAGHFFVLSDELKYAAYPVYAVTCLPVTFFAVAQFQLYIDLVWATFKQVPERRYMVVTT